MPIFSASPTTHPTTCCSGAVDVNPRWLAKRQSSLLTHCSSLSPVLNRSCTGTRPAGLQPARAFLLVSTKACKLKPSSRLHQPLSAARAVHDRVRGEGCGHVDDALARCPRPAPSATCPQPATTMKSKGCSCKGRGVALIRSAQRTRRCCSRSDPNGSCGGDRVDPVRWPVLGCRADELKCHLDNAIGHLCLIQTSFLPIPGKRVT